MWKVLTQNPPESDVFQAAAAGDQAWLLLGLRNALGLKQTDKQGRTLLHIAAMYGQLGCLKQLLKLSGVDVNASCPRGLRPLHMAVSSQSRPHSLACLTCLLEHGALPNVSSNEGLTPLHLAATEGLLQCTLALVQAGADMSTQDSRGHTALDLARVWGHREIVRFLRDAMWQEENQRDAERRSDLLKLKKVLIKRHLQIQEEAKVARQAVSERSVESWAKQKGLPVPRPAPTTTLSQGLTHHCATEENFDQESRKQLGRAGAGAGKRGRGVGNGATKTKWNISPNPSKPPPAIIRRLQGVRMSARPEHGPQEPDLRSSVTLMKRGDPHAPGTARLSRFTYQLPALPWDTIQETLFPNLCNSRITYAHDFHPVRVQDLPHLRNVSSGTTPWTEVAMHLAETLEPGRY